MTENKFKRIEEIRNKVQNEFYKKIKDFIVTNNLELSKVSFEKASINNKYS
jgi:hypothetical protein